MAKRRARPTRLLRIDDGAWYDVTARVAFWPRPSSVSTSALATDGVVPTDDASPRRIVEKSPTGSAWRGGRFGRVRLKKKGWSRASGEVASPRSSSRMPVNPSTSEWWILM